MEMHELCEAAVLNYRLDMLRQEIKALWEEASRPQGLSHASYASLRALADELGRGTRSDRG